MNWGLWISLAKMLRSSLVHAPYIPPRPPKPSVRRFGFAFLARFLLVVSSSHFQSSAAGWPRSLGSGPNSLRPLYPRTLPSLFQNSLHCLKRFSRDIHYGNFVVISVVTPQRRSSKLTMMSWPWTWTFEDHSQTLLSPSCCRTSAEP